MESIQFSNSMVNEARKDKLKKYFKTTATRKKYSQENDVSFKYSETKIIIIIIRLNIVMRQLNEEGCNSATQKVPEI